MNFLGTRWGVLATVMAGGLLSLALGGGAYFPVRVLSWAALVVSGAVLVRACLTALSLRWSESFSTDHPVKGSTIVHRLSLANEGRLTLDSLEAHVALHTDGVLRLPVPLAPGTSQVWEHHIPCRHRGVYEVGLAALSRHDPLGLLDLWMSRQPRTFYVYPRVIPLDREPLDRGRESLGGGLPDGRLPEPGTVAGLQEWRPGMNSGAMDHKRHAATGKVLLRVPDRREDPAMDVVLDLGTLADRGPAVLDAEDCLMDACFSLLRRAVDQGRPWKLTLWARESRTWHGSTLVRFTELWKRSLAWTYEASAPPLAALPDRGGRYLLTVRHPAWQFARLAQGTADPGHLICAPGGLGEAEQAHCHLMARTSASVTLIHSVDDLVKPCG